MLDNLYKEYEDFIDNHLNNVEGLLDEAINYLKDPATKTDFLDTWDTYMSKYDFQPESDLKSVLDKLGKGESGDIVAAINGVQQAICGVNSNIANIKYAMSLGNKDMAQQLAACCCDIRESITRGNYDNQLQTVNQTNQLQQSINTVATSQERCFANVAY